ncbi:MAG: DUF3558 domain-containing protein [Pseudonocardiaceae bacterium]
MSIRTGIAAPALLVLLAVGCSAPQASPSAPGPRPAEPPLSVASPPPAAVALTGLAAIQACDLLTAQEASSLGMLPQGKANTIIGLRRCNWNTPDGDGMSTSINDHRGINALNLDGTTSVTDVTIGRHRGKRILEDSASGSCQTIFAVGDTANVTVLAIFVKDTPRACAVADRAAVLVESKLP